MKSKITEITVQQAIENLLGFLKQELDQVVERGDWYDDVRDGDTSLRTIFLDEEESGRYIGIATKPIVNKGLLKFSGLDKYFLRFNLTVESDERSDLTDEEILKLCVRIPDGDLITTKLWINNVEHIGHFMLPDVWVEMDEFTGQWKKWK